MSIATEISRIQTNRNTIRAKLVELGIATNTANLDTLAAAIDGIINQGAVSVEILEGTTYTIPAGWHNGSGTVKAMTDTTGEAETYKTQAKTATPTKKQQSVTPDTGYYALSSVTIAPIPDAYQDVTSVTAEAGDVLTGKIIVTAEGEVITGTMANNGKIDKVLDATTVTYTIPKGYHSGTGTVKISLETKTVTPTKSKQTITPAAGNVLSSVEVDPIPDEYITTTDATAAADQILMDETAYVGGEKVTGTMPNRGSQIGTLHPQQVMFRIEKGYHDGTGYVSISPETKDATPTKSAQTITPTLGKVLKQVNVAAIPDEYQVVTAVTATAADVLTGKKIVDATGVVLTGTMADNGAVSASVNGIDSVETEIAAGYTSGGKVTFDDTKIVELLEAI